MAIAIAVAIAGCGPSRAPASEAFVTVQGDRVRAPHLGEGWRCADDAQQDDSLGVDSADVRCARDDLALLAKDAIHREAPDQSVKELASVTAFHLFVDKYGPARVLSEAKVAHQGHDGYEVEFETNDGAVHLRDRVVLVGTHILDVAAMGKPAMFAKYGAAIAHWFDRASFGVLAPAPVKE